MTDNCALNPDGSLKDASEIAWVYSPAMSIFSSWKHMLVEVPPPQLWASQLPHQQPCWKGQAPAWSMNGVNLSYTQSQCQRDKALNKLKAWMWRHQASVKLNPNDLALTKIALTQCLQKHLMHLELSRVEEINQRWSKRWSRLSPMQQKMYMVEMKVSSKGLMKRFLNAVCLCESIGILKTIPTRTYNWIVTRTTQEKSYILGVLQHYRPTSSG